MVNNEIMVITGMTQVKCGATPWGSRCLLELIVTIVKDGDALDGS